MMKKIFNWKAVVLLAIIVMMVNISPAAYAESPIKILIDGKEIKAEPEAFIKNDRTLVPIRVIAEGLGAEVTWDNDNRTVHISKEDMHVALPIDSHLIQYTLDNETMYNLSDVASIIKDDRTFVPIRVISNALGVGIDWDNNKRAVIIDSSEKSDIEPFFEAKISSLKSGQVITGKTFLSTDFKNSLPAGAAEIKYLLIDSNSNKGFIVARGKDLNATYEWIPSMEEKGNKALVAAVYDNKGNFIAGDAIPVMVNIKPEIKLTGLKEGQLITEDSVPLGASVNFVAAYVKYEIINPDNGAYYISPSLDPEGGFTMIPVMEDNGNMSLRVIAYDTKNNPYYGDYVNVKVDVDRYINLGGVAEGQSIDNTVTLRTSRNFNVTETEYVMVDNLGTETVLYKAGYGSYSWFPSPDMAGMKSLYVRVKDTAGNVYISNKINVNVVGSPKILLQGIGPNQVVTDTINLSLKTNIKLENIKYILTNLKTGASQILNGTSYTPSSTDSGSWSLRAEASYGGKTLKTEEVKFTIYPGNIYTAKPVVPKDQFLDFASGLAVDAKNRTGMSAALQTAQAILETGWGQSVPVDKYTGQFSNNLFGIKGTGSAGSVTSNTWEEYNGVSFRIDAEFRAYNKPVESWNDHKELLLTKERYAPFRAVMFESTQGAWALKRCGYATDSAYPIKLIDIMNRYNLRELDRVEI